MRPRTAFATWTFALCSACIGDLAHKEIVLGPRVLEIVADPPELGAGQTVRLHATLAGTLGTPRFHWVACGGDTTSFSGLGGFGAGVADDGCTGDAGPHVPLGDTAAEVFTVPAALADVAAIRAALGPSIPAAFVDRYLRDVGILVGVGLTVEVDGRVLRAYKRVVLSTSATPNHNPPPPRLRVAGHWVGPTAADPETCAAEDGMPLTVAAGALVNLEPDTDASWFETYTVLAATGTFQPRTEHAYWSWYASGGALDQAITQTPTVDDTWQAPGTAGPQTLWVFLRDGRGGTSGCRVSVTVR